MFSNIKKLTTIAVVCLLAVPLLFSGCSKEEADTGEDTGTYVDLQQEQGSVDLNLLCVGDIMAHSSQISSQYDSNLGAYDYTNNYKYVKPYISGADLAMCNVETTFAGQPYSGYPNFSAPDELAAAIRDAGFDLAVTANNHMMDKGTSGLLRTLDVLRANQLMTAGSRLTVDEPRFVICELKGVKVGVVAYTYETPSNGSGTFINSVKVPDETANLINSFSTQTLDEDLAAVKEACQQARDYGAQVIVLYYHWGNEYQTTADQWQRKIAQYSVDEIGADVIFASHPHVLQEMEYYTKINSNGDTVNVPVFFSMGNFISNQRLETLNNRYTETGIIASATLTFDKDKNCVVNATMSAVPTWVEKYNSGGKPVYEIIPLDENLDSNETLQTSGHLSRAQQALEDSNGILKFD